MFNSVAKYLWGGAENESDYTGEPQQGGCNDSESGGDGGQPPASLMAPAEECGQEDDWVLVGEADKENANILPVAQHHYYHLHHHHHRQSHHSSLDSLPQPTAAEVELLDDAASLVITQHQNCGDPKSLSDQEDNGMDSGLRPSSPESVFSACSGRSSATYRPHGVESEAWVVAPPPCFTGSQCGSFTTPLESSPLENLLIEHPSMSVYVSQPATNILLSWQADNHQNVNLNLQGLSSILDFSGSATVAFHQESTMTTPLVENDETETADADTTRVSSHHRLGSSGTPSRRHHNNDAAAHQQRQSLEKIMKAKNSAQSKAVCISQQRSISKQKCQRQNQVRDGRSTPKGRINRKNKQSCPSGYRSARCVTQRNSSSSSAKHV